MTVQACEAQYSAAKHTLWECVHIVVKGIEVLQAADERPRLPPSCRTLCRPVLLPSADPAC